MAEKRDSKEIAALADALKVEMVVNQALIDVLVDKNILTHDEIQSKINEIKVREGIVLSSDASSKVPN